MAFSSIKSFEAFELSDSKDGFKEKMVPLNNEKFSLFIFLSKDCPCSNANLEYIEKLKNEFSTFDFYAIHANLKASSQEVYNHFKEKISFPLYNDPELKVANSFRALKTPHAFILSPGGEIIYSGGITNTVNPVLASNHYLKKALTNLNAGKPIGPSTTKTLGCYIAR